MGLNEETACLNLVQVKGGTDSATDMLELIVDAIFLFVDADFTWARSGKSVGAKEADVKSYHYCTGLCLRPMQ